MRTLRLLAFLAILLLIALGALRFVPLDPLRNPIDHALSSAIGKPVRIDGDINVEIDLDPHIEIDKVAIWDLPGGASFERFELEFQLLSLLRGVFEISEIVLVGGNIATHDAEDPEQGEAVVAPERKQTGTRGVDLRHVNIVGRDLDIVHTNRAGLATRIRLERLAVLSAEPERPIEIVAVGAFDGLAFDLRGELGSPALLESGGAFPVEVSGAVADLQLRASGHLDRPRELAGVDVALALDAPHLAALAELGTGTLPEIGPVHIQATLIDLDGALGIENAMIQVGDAEDPIVLTAEGAVDDLADLDEIAFRISLRARDLPLIGELLELPLPHVETVTLTGSFRGSDERLASEGFSLGLDETVIGGVLSGTFVPGDRPTLKARLESSVVHLDDIGIEESPTAPDRSRREEGGFTAESDLPFDALPDLDAHLEVRVDEIVGEADLMIDELRVDVVLTEERLALENLQVNFAGGAVRGAMAVQHRTSPPAMSLDLDASGVRIDRVLAQFEQTPSLSGLVDAAIHLKSRGRSVREWTSNAAGAAAFLVRKGRVRTKYATSLERDLLKAAFRSRGPSEFSEIRCLLSDFQLRRGVAEIQTLWFETNETSIRAEGHLDLARRLFDVKVTPQPKKPGLLGFAASVSVTGPFAKPKILPIPGSLATSVVKGLFSGLKRPVDPIIDPVSDTVLGRFWKRRGGEKGPCAGFAASES